MNIIDIITKKKNKESLTKEDINYVIDNYVTGKIEDYQVSSLLMAICINGMTDEEVFNLTDAMLNSGDKIDLSKIEGIKIDKHSTGGIGDKTTIILAPLVASLGVKVAKMSGRGLGYTGGTIDKLESIEGFNVEIDRDNFIEQVNKVGAAIVSQTGNLVPADKKLYSLRDVTGTVESIALIASSIMSKKLASGADKFVIDVKVGNGALMKTIDDARKLATLMVKNRKNYNKEVVCFLTNMDTPLGLAVGNGLEIYEAIDVLKNKGEKNLTNLIVELASEMVSLGLSIDKKEAKEKVLENLENGKAYDKLEEIVKFQKGDIEHISKSNNKIEILSDKTGYINQISAIEIGKFVHELGAGRNSKADKIDYGVGIVLNKKVGDFVNQGDKLLTIYYNKKIDFNKIREAFLISDIKQENEKIIYEVINEANEC